VTDSLAAELAAPWGGALLRLIADPLEDADPAMLPTLPVVGSTAQALASSVLRGRLARALCDASPEAIAALREAMAQPRARLGLIPVDHAIELMAFGTAWVLGSQLGKLIRLADVHRARDALGDAAWDFAIHRAPTMPGITAALAAAIGFADSDTELDRLHELRPGGALFGLAAGPLPKMVLQRLRLRRPAANWAVACDHARSDPAGEAAFLALRRILRDRAMPWSI
jgi:hypothetical protein